MVILNRSLVDVVLSTLSDIDVVSARLLCHKATAESDGDTRKLVWINYCVCAGLCL